MALLQDRAAGFRWDDVRIFLALARGRTLARAAASVGVDATTIGRRLTALEHALGTALFDRRRDGMSLTAAGEQLVPLAEETERGAAGLFAAANNLEAEAVGVVRLTTPPVVAELLVVPLLPELARRHPKIQLELDASIGFADLTRREADLALRLRKPSSGDLVVTRLFAAAYGLFASRSLADRLGAVAKLSAIPFIGWTAELAGIPAATWATRHVDPNAVVLRAGSLATQLAAAREGFGVLLAPAAVARIYDLVPVAVRGDAKRAAAQAPHEEIWLVGHRALRNVPRVAAVWELLAHGAPKLVGAPR